MPFQRRSRQTVTRNITRLTGVFRSTGLFRHLGMARPLPPRVRPHAVGAINRRRRGSTSRAGHRRRTRQVLVLLLPQPPQHVVHVQRAPHMLAAAGPTAVDRAPRVQHRRTLRHHRLARAVLVGGRLFRVEQRMRDDPLGDSVAQPFAAKRVLSRPLMAIDKPLSTLPVLARCLTVLAVKTSFRSSPVIPEITPKSSSNIGLAESEARMIA
jgi:hypothetical protein